MSKWSDQPDRFWKATKDTWTECPFCGARNCYKYELDEPAEYQCHSCYSDISVTIQILRTPSETTRN